MKPECVVLLLLLTACSSGKTIGDRYWSVNDYERELKVDSGGMVVFK